MNELFKIELFILHFRETLSDECATARSIDRNDSWRSVARIARREGHTFLSDHLEQACHGLVS